MSKKRKNDLGRRVFFKGRFRIGYGSKEVVLTHHLIKADGITFDPQTREVTVVFFADRLIMEKDES